MALTSLELSGLPAFHDEVRLHARALLEAHEQYPRLSSVFATEQRAMMGSIAFSLYFMSEPEAPRRSFTLARYLDLVESYSVASRNTADAFIKEMLKYGYLRYADAESDRRARPFEATETSMDGLLMWAMAHLRTLDNFDGGKRVGTVAQDPDVLFKLHPLIAVGLVGDGRKEEYSGTLSLFAWVVNSKLFFLRILAGMGPVEEGATQITTDIDSIPQLAAWMNVSQTHFARKLREAEDMGSIGWSGPRGQSPMWISTQFLHEMTNEQASRLAFFDTAFEAVFPGGA
tara:strand:+ start:2784 stop:3644 length:861 start_codon:yes stop_codon:yes gene_type:complete